MTKAPARPIHTHEGEAGPRRTVSQVSNPQILLQSRLLLPFLTGAGAWLTRQDPKMFHLWVLSFRLASHYDPGKE